MDAGLELTDPLGQAVACTTPPEEHGDVLEVGLKAPAGRAGEITLVELDAVLGDVGDISDLQESITDFLGRSCVYIGN